MLSIDTESFIERWEGKGNEKSDTQKFWLELLRDVLGMEKPEQYIEFEKNVALEHTSYIDAYIPLTRTLIEQKSIDVNLDTPAKQSDGTSITPFQQAKRYYDWLPVSQRGRYIVICNFSEFRIYDMEQPRAQPEVITLSSLAQDWRKLLCLVDINSKSPKEIHELQISIRAGELVGKLYDALLSRYVNPDDPASQRSLNVFCVRLVFLLYAEDSGLLGKSQFHDYLKARQNTARETLVQLFRVLSQDIPDRDPYINADLKAFPYVDGGLFDGQEIEIPQLDGEPLRIILEDMSEGFDWSGISPTIFGAVFESTLNPNTRHSGGMHYTSIENIHRVIDPLFMDDLNAELDTIMASPTKTRAQKLRTFQKKLGTLKFFDPACGSGNFLTEAYLSLRRLENRILSELSTQISFTDTRSETPIQVKISQFYGIEINDFAVSVARTALWIAEAQMWNETNSIIQFYGDLLPLTTYSNILEANALLTDWHEVITPDDKLYIMGNPPFLGYSIQNKQQKQDILKVFCDEECKPYKAAGKVDYVVGWYYKACEYIMGTRAHAAFVSTNSITQGEQVGLVFKPLYERFGIHIDFAWTTFTWDSESEEKAQVHVVVIGFNAIKDEEIGRQKRLYTPEGLKLVENINFYLIPAANVFTVSRQKQVCPDEAPDMMTGNRPADGGHLIIEAEEYEEFIRREPRAKKYIKRYMMGNEFINGIMRYCLWLVNATPQDIHDMPQVRKRAEACKQFRLSSTKGATRKLADTSWLFAERRQPTTNYLAIPMTSSKNRYYIPMGFVDNSVIPGDGGLLIVPDATKYHFGILTSRVHMAWMRVVCGRLKSDYRYSKHIVYNCFAWPTPSDKQRARITATAQAILDARANHPECTYAALYDYVSMPTDLRKAHRDNDAAACEAYGFSDDIGEMDIVAKLFEMYEELAGH